jgi:class 3 adenylate cyclase
MAQFNQLGFYLCLWRLYVTIFSASGGVGMQARKELGSVAGTLKQCCSAVKGYDDQIQKHYDALYLFAQDTDSESRTVINALLKRFREEVLGALSTAESKPGSLLENEIDAILQMAHRSCSEIAAQAEQHSAQTIGKLYEEICVHAVIDHPTVDGQMTIVSVDLAQYGRMAEGVDSVIGASGIFKFNEDIRGIMERALEEKHIPLNEAILVNTGDGVLAFLKSADHAVEFAEAVHLEVLSKNTQKSPGNQLHFRTGISTGFIVVQKKSTRDQKLAKHDMGGKPIAIAVRLQAACHPGRILICEDTYKALKGTIKGRFGKQSLMVQGKAHEISKIKARSYSVYSFPQAEKKKKSKSFRRKKKNSKRKKSKGKR